jgi:DNA/RNA endonuclease YhcR with UshA esterase domain
MTGKDPTTKIETICIPKALARVLTPNHPCAKEAEKMKKHLFGMALLTCLVVISGVASAQITNIGDIQVYDAITGLPNSPFEGQSVTVSGGITVVKGTYNGGTWYLQDATGGMTFYDTAAGPFALGDIIEVTGTVSYYSGEIQLSSPSAVFISAGTPVAATTVDLSVLDYENVGMIIEVIGDIAATSFGADSGTFSVTNGPDTLLCYIDRDTGIDFSAMAVGDAYSASGPLVNYNGLLEIKPRFQADLVENPGGDTLPVISGMDSPNWVVEMADPLVITASIVDDSAVVSANLYYADSDGTTQGAFSSVAMSNVGGDTWSGTIPGGHSGAQIDFYLEATDDGAQTVTNPANAPVGFHSAAVGFTSLYAINTVDPDSPDQISPLLDRFVNITGVVTAGTGTATGAQSRFVVQEMSKRPLTKSYAYGGILVYEGSGTYEYFRGDEVEINGQVGDFNGLNEMIPLSANSVKTLSFDATLPEATVVSTRELADNSLLDGNGILGTRWESVWVKTHPSAVVDTLGYGEYIISSSSSRADSLDVDPIAVLAYQPTIGDVITIESYITFAGGQFEIVPFSDAFITQTGLSAVDDTPAIQVAGGFRSVAPNPFNPMTEIKFVVNRDNLVQLNVYNIRGQKVRTLVQDHMSANEYKFEFDGKNDAGQNLASGAYFARLRIGKEVVQVRQMMLVK